ncbi:uncharacterized protein LOC143153039 [Ptiloglossa arizonensis]|uniref:uncharacterized protein LOC143153039 n=1 Tax=Ptiloglossa arizonensis TaxID=3350558 RepID=UPI003FA06124
MGIPIVLRKELVSLDCVKFWQIFLPWTFNSVAPVQGQSITAVQTFSVFQGPSNVVRNCGKSIARLPMFTSAAMMKFTDVYAPKHVSRLTVEHFKLYLGSATLVFSPNCNHRSASAHTANVIGIFRVKLAQSNAAPTFHTDIWI